MLMMRLSKLEMSTTSDKIFCLQCKEYCKFTSQETTHEKVRDYRKTEYSFIYLFCGKCEVLAAQFETRHRMRLQFYEE